MKSNTGRRIRISLVALGAVSLIALAAFGLWGATSEEDTVTPKDVAQMKQYLNEYWKAKQVTWPEQYRGGNQKRLPAEMKESIASASRDVMARVTTGRLGAWEKEFDRGGFLEEMRASGSVVTESNYKILRMDEPVLVSQDTAVVEVSVLSWSKQFEVDEEGAPKGEPYKATDELIYEYTFERIEGIWRISSQRLLNNPV